MNAKQTFIKSTLILGIATLLSKILGSVYRIPLQNIAGDDVLGIFTAVYPVYMVALTLSVAGIPIAISQLIAQAQTLKEDEKIFAIHRTAAILAIIFGVLSFSIIYLFSDSIAYVLGGPQTKLALLMVSATLLIAPYMAVYRGYFQGFSDMKPTGFSQVLEQFVRVVIILVMAYILVQNGLSEDKVAGWIMIGSVAGAAFSLFYLQTLFIRSPLKPKKSKLTFATFKVTAKQILKLSLPICIGAITMALLNFVDSITIPASLRANGLTDSEITYTYGIYGRGLSLVQIVTVVATSMVLPLIPLMTKMLAKNEKNEARGMIEKTHYITHLVSWPAAIGILALVIPINIALFKNTVGSGTLGIIGLSSVFTALVLLGTGVLQGMNLAKVGAYIIVGGTALKVLTNYFLVAEFGLIGAAYSTLIVYIVLFIVNSFMINRALPYSVWNAKITKIVVSALIMGAVVYAPSFFFDLEVWNRSMALLYTLVFVGVGAIVYAICIFALKAITKEDLQALPFVSKFFKKKETNQSTSTSNNRWKNRLVAKGGKRMKKGLWILLIISLLLSIPGIYERHVTETKNNNYELVVPFASIDAIANGTEMTLQEVLTGLKENGLQAVSFEPETVASLTKKGMVTVVTSERMTEMAYFDPKYEVINLQREGLYIFIDESNELTTSIKQAFPKEKIISGTVDDKEYFFVEGKQEVINRTPIRYSVAMIDMAKDAGLNIVIRVPNSTRANANTLYNEAIELAKENKSNILYSGLEVVGFPSEKNIQAFSDVLKNNDLGIYTIEFTDQKGLKTSAKAVDYNIIRLHSVNMATYDVKESIDRSIRAIKERNFRSIFITANDSKGGEAAYDDLVSVLNGIKEGAPSNFTLAKATAFEQMDIPTWSYYAAMIAAASFIALAAAYVFNLKWLTILGFVGMLGLMGGFILLDRLLIVQLIALIVAVVAPIFAVLPLPKVTSIKQMLLTYGRAIGITSIGILIVVALLNGNEFLMKIEEFRGVKLVYIIPMVFVFFYASYKHIPKLLNTQVKYWHLVIIGIIGIVGLYYISRTGNSGSVSSLELAMRSFLEDALYVRPRTKEFLIGFPLFILALYMTRHSKAVAHYVLVGGVIGFLSMTNTFTHFHIPLYVSLLRTVYSLVLGLGIGFIFIYVYKWCYKFYMNKIKPRWS